MFVASLTGVVPMFGDPFQEVRRLVRARDQATRSVPLEELVPDYAVPAIGETTTFDAAMTVVSCVGGLTLAPYWIAMIPSMTAF